MGRTWIRKVFRHRKLVVLAAVVLVVLAGWLAFEWLTSSAHLSELVCRELAARVGGDVRVAGVEFGLLSGVVVRELELREDDESAPWASVGAIHVVHRPGALLRGSFEVETVRVVEPRLVVSDASIAKLRRLFEEPAGEGPSPASISIERGSLLVLPNSYAPELRELAVGPIFVRLENPDRRGDVLLVEGEAETAAGHVAFAAQVDSAAHSARLEVSCGDLALEELPLGCLPEAARRRREVREVTGRIGGQARGRVHWGGEKLVVAYAAQVWFDDVAFPLQDYPFAVSGLAGDVRARPGQITLSNAAGRVADSRFQVEELRLALGKDGGLAELFARVSAQDVRLSDAVRAALPKAVQDGLERLGVVSAAADASVRLSQKGQAAPSVLLDLDVREATLRPKELPYLLPALSGRVHYDSAGGLVRLDDIEGSDPRLSLALDGTVGLAENRPSSSLRFTLSGLRLDGELRRALPKDLGATWDSLKIRGGTVGASGTLRSRKGQAGPFLAQATVRVEDLAMATEPPVDRLTGTVAVAAAGDEATAPMHLTVRVARARAAGLTLRDLNVVADVTPKLVDITELDWLLYGGRVAGKFQVSRQEPVEYGGELEFAHIDVESLASALGRDVGAPSGWLRGAIRFAGKGKDSTGLMLSGTCKVDRGRLYELPLIATVLNVLSLKLPGRGAITDAHVEFEIAKGILSVKHFLLAGQTTPLDITGTIELKPGVALDQQPINLLFTVPRGGQLLDKLPVIGWVKAQSVDRLTRHFLQARVSGSFAKPHVRTVATPVVGAIGGFWSTLRRVREEAARAVRK